MNFARELTLGAIQCQNQLTFVKSVLTNLDRKALLVCPKIRRWEFDIGRGSLHPIQNLHKGVRILPQENPRDNGNFVALIGTDHLKIPTFKEGRFFIQPVIKARIKGGAQGHSSLSYLNGCSRKRRKAAS